MTAPADTADRADSADHAERRVRKTAPDPLGFRTSHHRTLAWTTGLAALLLVTVILSVGIGSVSVSPADSVRILSHHILGTALDLTSPSDDLARHDAVIWTIRAPRAMLGAAVGAGLAIAGVVLQACVRNILADPYVLGVNSGASVGAAAAILTGIGAGFGDYALQTSAFLGAALASLVVFGVARTGGRITSTRLIMAGVAVGYALSALTSFMIFASDSAEGSRSVMFWLLGSLGLASWSGALLATVLVVLLVTAVLLVLAPRMDALAAGDETALTLGINPDRMRIVLLVLSCLLVGTVVAMAGSIGFVGLVVPHLARRLVGGAHRAVIPVSALLGAILLLWADIGSRTLLAPQEIPIGIITAIVGAPFLLVLVHRMHKGATE
ncbi:MAG: FecCD family ABC transporter permease [Mycobacteriaceae bacterium]|uniref:FecCD family ABC transporter permease n=1 Tax=Corynebacterium sp. TaxID=1720 RepID=UPI003F9CE7CA